jgi:hypothetical protein
MKIKPPKFQAQILFLGVMMMLMNVGSRHIVDEFSSDEKEYSRNIFLRRVAIFAVCYMGTRDLYHALLLTAGFVVLGMGISKSHPNEGFKDEKEKHHEPMHNLDGLHEYFTPIITYKRPRSE